LAFSGDSAHARTLADDLGRRFPEDTSVQFSYLPTIRARLALNHGKPAKAIELLSVASANELGSPRTTLHANFGALYPVYMRGEAYLSARRCSEAAAEFQKILDHQGVVASDPVGAVAQLQLARAYAMQGDSAKARTAYQAFLTLWKDADPDVPIYKAAGSEYSKLK
jgi:tetratricopeptide (TPR) repeat protein